MALTNADLPKLVELLNLIDIRVQKRRRTAADWVAGDEVLLSGEEGLETDTGLAKVGNGVSTWTALPYKGANATTFAFVAETSTTTAADPGAGALKWSHATQSSAANLYLDDVTVDGVDLSTFLGEQGPTGFLHLVAAGDSSKWQVWKWTALADNTGWWTFDVEFQAGAGSFADGQPLRASFVAAGGANYVAGSHINIDATDPAAPVINVTGISTAGYAEGTVNPASPGLNDKFYRTDLNLLIFYDGTRWLTVQEYEAGSGYYDRVGGSGNTTDASITVRLPVRSDFRMFITRWVVYARVFTTNNSTNYWNVSLAGQASDATSVTIPSASFNTKTDPVNTLVQHDKAINSVLDSAALGMFVFMSKVGAPGGIVPASAVYYRLVVP